MPKFLLQEAIWVSIWEPFWSILAPFWESGGQNGDRFLTAGRRFLTAGRRFLTAGRRFLKTCDFGTILELILKAFFHTFSDFWSLFWRPAFDSVFERLLGSILERLGVIFLHIFGMCGLTFSTRPRKWKMWFGFIICYKSSTWAFADTGRKS